VFPIHWVQTPAIAIPGLVLCAVLSYYLIERPCIRFGQRLTGRRTAVPSGQLIPPIERG
jgi:peptidoglycan/LPS O-acetylase OafA/YrhL